MELATQVKQSWLQRFENLLDKDLAIIDECEVSPKMLNAFKLFGSGEIMSINAKNKPIVYERLTTKILACANPSDNLKDFLADKAIQNRVVLFIFTNSDKRYGSMTIKFTRCFEITMY